MATIRIESRVGVRLDGERGEDRWKSSSLRRGKRECFDKAEGKTGQGMGRGKGGHERSSTNLYSMFWIKSSLASPSLSMTNTARWLHRRMKRRRVSVIDSRRNPTANDGEQGPRFRGCSTHLWGSLIQLLSMRMSTFEYSGKSTISFWCSWTCRNPCSSRL